MLNNLKNFIADNKGQFGEITIPLLISVFLIFLVIIFFLFFLAFFIKLIIGIILLAIGTYFTFYIALPYLKQYIKMHPDNKNILIVLTAIAIILFILSIFHTFI